MRWQMCVGKKMDALNVILMGDCRKAWIRVCSFLGAAGQLTVEKKFANEALSLCRVSADNQTSAC